MSQNWAEGVRSFGNNPNTFVYPGPGGSAGGCCTQTTIINNITTTGLTGTVDPNGNVTANPGTNYFNTTDLTFWVKATGTGNTGWTQLI